MKVNLCGITNEEQLMNAIKFGVDNIGFKVGQMNRARDFILNSTAQRLALNTLAYINIFLITEYADIYEVISLIKSSNIKTIELHSSFSIKEIAYIRKNIPENVNISHVIKLTEKLDIESVKEYYPYINSIIIDITSSAVNPLEFDQERCVELMQQFVKNSLLPIIIKGIEDPITLEATLNIIKPFAVSLDYDKLEREFTSGDDLINKMQIYEFVKNLKGFPATIPEKFYLNSQK